MIWDVTSGDVVSGPFIGHTDWGTPMAFSRDGLMVASGSLGGTVKIWNVTSGSAMGNSFKCETSQLSLPYHFNFNVISSAPTASLSHFHDFDSIYCRSYITSTGWVIFLDESTGDENLLYWVPVAHRTQWCDFRTIKLIGKPEVRVSYGDFVHGPKWVECKSKVCLYDVVYKLDNTDILPCLQPIQQVF